MERRPESLPALLLLGALVFGASLWMRPSWMWFAAALVAICAAWLGAGSKRVPIFIIGLAAGFITGFIHRPTSLDAGDYGVNIEWRGAVESVRKGANSQTCVVDVGNGARVRAVLCSATPEVDISDSISFFGIAEEPYFLERLGVPGLTSSFLGEGPVAAVIMVAGGKFSIIPSQAVGNSYADRFSAFLYSSGLSVDSSALLCSAWLGRDDIAPDLRDSFRALGLAHLLCVSGMHIGLIALMLIWLLRPFAYFQKAGRLRYFVLIALVWAYAALTGLHPSAFRAAAMITVFYIVEYCQTGRNTLNTLCLAAAVVLCANPWWLFAIGFQLSVMAVLGIVVLIPALNPFIGGSSARLVALGNMIMLPVATLISTFPVMVYWFSSISVVTVFTNIIAALLFPVFMFGGIIAALLLHAGVPHAIAATPVDWITDLLIALCDSGTATTLRLTNLHISDSAMAAMLAILFAMLVIVRIRKGRIRRCALVLCTAAMICIVIWPGHARREIIVYSSGGHASALISGMEAPIAVSTHPYNRPRIATPRYLALQGYDPSPDAVLTIPDNSTLGQLSFKNKILTLDGIEINLADEARKPKAYLINY